MEKRSSTHCGRARFLRKLTASEGALISEKEQVDTGSFVHMHEDFRRASESSVRSAQTSVRTPGKFRRWLRIIPPRGGNFRTRVPILRAHLPNLRAHAPTLPPRARNFRGRALFIRTRS